MTPRFRVRLILYLLLGLALIAPALGDASRAPRQMMLRSTGTYTGPGNINSYASIFLSVRAYTAAQRGNALMNVCDSTGGTDVACADMFSDVTSGALVPLTIGGINCPANANCTVKTWYDQANNRHVTQATVASRPKFTTSFVSGGKVCVSFNGSQNLAFASLYSGATAGTGTFVANRTGNTTVINGVLYSNGLAPLFGFGNAVNTLGMYMGSTVTAAGNDNTGHAVQVRFNSASSFFYRDGVQSANLNPGTTPGSGTTQVGGGGASPFPLIGSICEVGFSGADLTANNTAINSNQHAYYNF